MKWTTEQITELKRLSRTCSLKEIAEHLELTPHEVRYQIRKLGLTTKAPHERKLKDAQAVYDYSNERGVTATATRFGLSVEAVKSLRARHKKRTETRNKKLTVEHIEHFRRQALSYARRDGFREAADFASYAVCEKITNPDRKFDLKYLLIDYKRAEFGNSRTLNGQAEIKARYSSEAIGSERADGTIVDIAAEPDDWLERLLARISRAKLSQEQRVLLLLLTWVGLSQTEIALVFGVTDGSISQKVTEISRILRKETE